MKETKYIPGDLVMFKNPFEPSDTCVGIVKFLGNISDLILLCPYTNLNLEYFIKVENIQGIPITPEILEKNGWKRTQIFIDDDGLEFHTYIDDERCLDLQYYPQYKKFAAFICKQEVLSDIEYVHQLQHLLFGLGINHEMEV